MELLTLTNTLALLAFLALLNSLFSKDNKKAKLFISVFLGLGILTVTFFKTSRDIKSSKLIQSKSDSLQNTVDHLSKKNLLLVSSIRTIDTPSDKVEIFKTFVKKLDSLGITRDVINNVPLVTKTFINHIHEVGTLNQY